MVIDEFEISPQLIQRFNAWQAQLVEELGLSSTSAQNTYRPLAAGQPLESIVDQQIAWISAWRIARFAHVNSNQYITRQAFYQQAAANSIHQDNAQRQTAQQQRDQAQKAIERARLHPVQRETPGLPLFEPALDQAQLLHAAQNFETAYRFGHNGVYLNNGFSISTLVDTVFGKVAYLYNTDDEKAEFESIITAAEALYRKAFISTPYPYNIYEQQQDIDSYQVQARYEALIALYDNHIHDSRAWFMHAALDGVEPFSSFIRYRMIYFDRRSNKLDADNLEFYIRYLKGAKDYGEGLLIYSWRQLESQFPQHPASKPTPPVPRISIDQLFNQLGHAF